MKLPHLLFALLLGMCGVIVAAFMIDEVPYTEAVPEAGGEAVKTYLGHGFTHPKFETMQVGGDGAERHAKVLWLGWGFGILQIAFFLTCLAFGSRKHGRAGPFLKPIAIAGVIYAAIFTMMFVAYRGYANEDSHALFLALPIPTAWMIYGVWIFPLFYLLLYMYHFDTWTFTEEDQAEFDRIVAARRASEAREA